MKNKHDGFTLIELLVVLFIISILAGFLLPNLMSARQRGRDSRRKTDLGEIKNALRMYYNDNQGYPSSGALTFGGTWGSYMSLVPQDPLGSSSGYGYCVSDDKEAFLLWAKLENSGDSDIGGSQDRCPSSLCASGGDTCARTTNNCYYVCAD